MRWPNRCAGGLLFLAACNPRGEPRTQEDTGARDALADPAAVPLAGLCPPDQDHGGFVVDLGETGSLSGRIRDGVLPTDRPDLLGEAAGCQLLQAARPFCDPPCGTGEVCDVDEACRRYPSSVDLGLVVLEGPTASLSVPALQPGFSYEHSALPNDLLGTDTTLRLTTEGAALPPLALHGVVPPPLVELPAEVVLTRDQGLSLHWDPPQGLGRSVIAVTLTINVHGANPAWLACTLPDTGAAVLPEGLVSGLLASGVSGYPQLQVSRETEDHVLVGDSCADLVVRHRVSGELVVDGHTPCNDDSDCPDGQTCDLLLETCG